MKKSLILFSLLILATTAIAQDGGFPDPLPDPAGVPIVESILALLGLGGAYAVKLWRKKKSDNAE
ncbi:MAG: hypothetical protein RRY55_08995 [Bacteroidales bacterium]